MEGKEQVQVTLEENSWLRNPSALCSAHETLAASVIISLIYALLTHLPLMRARAVSMTFWSLQLLTGSVPINLATQYTTCFNLPPSLPEYSVLVHECHKTVELWSGSRSVLCFIIVLCDGVRRRERESSHEGL